MRQLFVLILFFSCLAFPSFGQKCSIIYEDGTMDNDFYPDWPRIGSLINSFRIIYDRYPSGNEELLQFLLDNRDYITFDPFGFNVKDKTICKIINNKSNTLSTTGDSCYFFIKKLKVSYGGRDSLQDYSEEKMNTIVGRLKKVAACRLGSRYRSVERIRNVTYKFVGGPADYQSSDYQVFLAVTKMRCFDENGTFVGYLYQNAPSLDFDNQRKFRYRVVFEGDFAKDTTSSRQITYYPPVMIPITMNRSGKFIYDLSHVKGWHFYYRDYPSSIHGVLGDIKLEDAIDQDYINTIKSHLTEFLKQHPEVETIKTWEYLMFNNVPKDCASSSPPSTN